MTKETAYNKIEELVTRFTEQIVSYKKSDYNETQTRRDFIDPFFKALGWDVDNENGNAEAYREVIHEDRVKVGKATKAPDYSFRLSGGKRLFFVEAKKPSVFIKDEVLPAYQVRRYGWSAKLAISIITDFEEFAIYDCSKKPLPTDKAAVARIKYLNYKDYLNEFDFIWDTFSKEKVLKGSFDKFIQGTANKKGTTTVDKAFLETLDSCRTILAESIAKLNPTLDEDEINFAVQQTIDRIIFLRIAEDRSIEPYGNLQNAVKQGNFYNNLFGLFRIADDKYNSGLFNFKNDTISQNLQIDNKVLKTIINQFYYPECPYEFSVLSVEILGSAYEQFLGKTITINKNHKAVIELKPEVRKAGGVYYTPQYIVDYIVENTLGKLTQNKTPKQVAELKVVDPACGSGSFLIGAYQHLLNWHSTFYQQNETQAKKDKALTPTGSLSTSIKKQILLNNIYGVDIDVNAVEVTKLSLLLKCMEGETQASIATQASLFNERVLPTLDNNIKSGNSLIDTDYYDNQIDFGEEKKIKPFNWQKAFPNVFNRDVETPKNNINELVKKVKHHAKKVIEYTDELEEQLNVSSEPKVPYGKVINGGFDVVIGNPPYVMLQTLELKDVFKYSLGKYISAKYKIDTYQLFTEKSLELLRKGGFVGFITPNTFLKNIHSEPLRNFILNNSTLKEILLFNYSVFEAASVDTCIFILKKGKAAKEDLLDVNISNIAFEVSNFSKINQSIFATNIRSDFNLLVSDFDTELLDKIKTKSTSLGNYCGAYFGIQTFDRTQYVSKIKENKHYEPVIDGGNIEPFKLKPCKEFVNYIPTAIKSGGNETIYRQDRICIRQIGAAPIATFVPANIFTLNTIYNLYLIDNKLSLKFLLAIINSRATKYFWSKNNSDEKKTFPKVKKEAILSIPIPNILNIKIYNQVENLVNQLLQLNIDIQTASIKSKKEQLKNKIEYCEDKINQLVYQQYDLTEEEIKIVQENYS